MFCTQTLKDTLEIHPKFLCRDWKNLFFQALQKEKNRTVNSQRGAILRIDQILNYGIPKSKNGRLFTNVEYTAISFIPAVNEVYHGPITLVLPLGLLIEAEGLIKVLIQPINMPSGYKFDPNRKVFTNGISSFGVDDTVTFRICSYRYKPKKIDCMGSIKDTLQNIVVDEKEFIEPSDLFTD